MTFSFLFINLCLALNKRRAKEYCTYIQLLFPRIRPIVTEKSQKTVLVLEVDFNLICINGNYYLTGLNNTDSITYY